MRACVRVSKRPAGAPVALPTPCVSWPLSKGVAPEVLRAAVVAGACDLGENYVQEWQAKRDALADLAIAWHFIGRIQRNKAAAIAACALVHSLTDERVARALDAAAAERGAPLPVLLQVNLAVRRRSPVSRPQSCRACSPPSARSPRCGSKA